MRTNFHSHTTRCQHASGTELDMARQAAKSGYTIMGFSDHCPWPFSDGFVSRIRMTPEMFPDYVETIRSLDVEGLRIYCALECEFFPEYMSWMKDLAAEYRLDYLILGNHFDANENGGLYFGLCKSEADMRKYVEMTTRGMESGMFACLAHPDLFLRSQSEFTPACEQLSRELCRAAKELGVPLEYNLLGLVYAKERPAPGLGYPCARFWEIASEEGACAIVGVDAHHVRHVDNAADYDKAAAYLDDLGIERITIL